MKRRNGFVSNSSSSSFVIYKKLMTEEQIKGLKQFYARMQEEHGDCLGDSYKTFRDDGKYIMGETYYIYDEFQKVVEELDLDIDDFYWEL